MEFTKDDLRAAYLEGNGDGVINSLKNREFEEDDFDCWFEFTFKDRLEEEQAFIETQAEIWRMKTHDNILLHDEGPGNR